MVGRILDANKKESDQSKKRNIKLVSYRAIAEIDEEHRKEGEALFPEHKSLKLLNSKKSEMGTANWEALYQQNPVIPGGSIFKTEWLQSYTELPRLQYRAIYADTAQKTEQWHDYTVFQCWGKGTDNRAYLIDLLRGKWEAPELQAMALEFWEKHNSKANYNKDYYGILRELKVEDKSSGSSLIQSIARIDGIPVIPIQRGKDKVLRGMDVAPYMESKNIVIPKAADWLVDYIAELTTFPFAKHDDQVDPTIDAIYDLMDMNIFTFGDLF